MKCSIQFNVFAVFYKVKAFDRCKGTYLSYLLNKSSDKNIGADLVKVTLLLKRSGLKSSVKKELYLLNLKIFSENEETATEIQK
jgi:hypothetical protein